MWYTHYVHSVSNISLHSTCYGGLQTAAIGVNIARSYLWQSGNRCNRANFLIFFSYVLVEKYINFFSQG